MKAIRLIILVAVALAGCIAAQAQLKLPTKNLGNDTYYYYKVKSGESIHGIAQQIGVSVDDLVRYNPSARDGVSKNQLLFLPVKDFNKNYKSPGSEPQLNAQTAPKTITHTVKSGESVYGIARSYNLSVDDLVASNPLIDNGINPGDEIIIPQPNSVEQHQATTPDEVPAVEPIEQGVIFHTIKRGESLYSVSKLYKTSIESLIELNPGVSAEHFRADDVIKVKPGDTRNITVNRPIKQFIPYEVKEGETYESIALANGIDVKELRAANPEMSKVKKGKTIYIPRPATETTVVNSADASVQDLERTYGGHIDEVYNEVHGISHDDRINIAIVLPFQLQKAEPPRQALLYTDFYRGFAVAIDSIGNNCGKQVTLDVYDTEHNLNVTDSLLALEKMKTYDVIIAPSEPKQLERINRFGKDNNVPILNVFSIKNDDYTTNPMTMQVNIPSSYLAGRVIEFIDKKFNDYTIVYLDDPDHEKKDIYRDLQNHFEKAGRPVKTLTIASELTAKKLSQYMDPGSSYLFLPSTGEKSLLEKVATGIGQAKEQRYDCDVALIGYPEYTMYTNEYKTKFQAIDTYMFSRFYNPRDYRVKSIEQHYKRLFDDEIMNTTPNMMLIGFDTGMFVIKGLAGNHELNSHEAAYKGIQTSFDFERVSNWGGSINKSVKFVHFTPDGKIVVEE